MKIKPCKICGCMPAIRFHGVENKASCVCSMHSCDNSLIGRIYETVEEAVESWNERQDIKHED